MSEQQWFYDLATGEVTLGKQEGWENRMGPYATRSEAEDALRIAQQRNAEAEAAEEAEREAEEDWGVPPAWN